MKIIWTVIRWFFGLTFCLGSIGGFANGDIGMSIFVLALGLLFLPPVTKVLFKKKTTDIIQNQQSRPENINNHPDNLVNVTSKIVGKNKTEMTISLNEENLAALFKQKQEQREAEINNYNYIPMQIQRQGIQLLESINILNTTKNLDTLIGRYDFIFKMYDDFAKASYNKRYISDIQVSIDQYKTMYYDRILKDFELKLLVQPDHENLKEYYTECLFNCFNGFYQEQTEQIETLKKDDAKDRRKGKIIEIGNQTIFEFDKNVSDNDKFKPDLKALKDILENLGNSSNKTPIAEIPGVSLQINNSIIINPKSSFQITLYNSDPKIIQKVINILKDENTWNKTKDLLPLFTLHDIKCKEVEEYILKYKPIYNEKLKEQLANSTEYQSASEKDKEIIEDELKDEIISAIPERADCDLKILFDYSEIDISIDNELIKKYGFDVISKYFGLSYYKDKIIAHWERKDFEDLLKADLVITAEEIEQEEILNAQTLKTLNLICNKEEGHFKRKNKAIEYLNENKDLLTNIGKHVAARNLFKLKPLPSAFNGIDINAVNDNWTFQKEYIKLIADTYRNSERNKEDISGDKSWVKGFRVEKFEDLNSNFVCLRARVECKKKYSKSNPPKLPFHVGCNCNLRTDI